MEANIVVFGFGAQGGAQARNIHDSGRSVSVCLPEGSPRIQEVREAGLPLLTDATRAAREATVASLLIPDREQPAFYREVLDLHLPKGALLVFAHGFNIHYRQIVPRPDLDVVLAAPMAQGATVRSAYSAGGVPCLIAVAKDATGRARDRAHGYARAISRQGPLIDTTFKEEVETDLFAEQAVLCGGMPELVRAAFETLVEKGYSADIAYFCCLRELKAIVDVVDRHGIAGLYERISDTARYGALTRGPRVIDDHVREGMRSALDEIRSGAFARELIEEHASGGRKMEEALKRVQGHRIEELHRRHRVSGSGLRK